MQKEELMLQKRLIELSRLSYQRGIVTYSDFLNLNELNILHTMPKTELYTTYKVFAVMISQSVRWLHFYLMLFVMSIFIQFLF